MKKLLYVVSTLKSTGPTNQLYNIVNNLDRKLFKPYIITLSPEGADTRISEFEGLDVKLYSLGLSRIKGVLFAKKYLQRLIDKIHPNLIHTQGVRADALLSTFCLKVPWVITCRNYPFHDYPMKFGKAKGYLMAWKHLAVLKSCTNVVACSKTITRLLKSRGVVAHSIQNGVEKKTQLLERACNMEEYPRPIFIAVGNLIFRKNMSFIVDAFNQFAENNDGSIIILGNGPEMPQLKSLSKTSRIYFLGDVNNVLDYLEYSDYFVSASFSEGLPNTVLEAFSAGLPVLLSDIPSHQELAEEATHSVAIFKLSEGSVELVEMFEKVDVIFSSKAKQESKQLAQSVFSAKKMSKKYQEKYQELLQ